eukprot:scaffold76438_cov56-Cyclotella_meneghiniana.AAC.1
MSSQPLLTQPPDDLHKLGDRDVSESKDGKADSELTDRENNHSNVPGRAVFQTAGTNQTIRVTNESLSRASELFSSTTDRTLTSIKSDDHLEISFDRHENISPTIRTDNSTRNSSQPNDVKSADRNTNPSTFQMAESNESIDVSKDSTMKGNALFSSTENELMNRIPAEPINNVSNPKSTAHHSDDCETSGKTIIPQSSVILSPMLQTADITEMVHSLTDSLSKADRLVFDQEVPSVNLSNTSSNTAVHAQNMAQRNDNKSTYKSDSSIRNPNHPFMMFQTAGKKQTIHISAESLSKANDLFSVEDETDVDQNMPKYNSCGAAAASRCDDTQPSPTFQTVGEKQTIHVSDESLTKANRSFSQIECRGYTHLEPFEIDSKTIDSSLDRSNKSNSTGESIIVCQTAHNDVAVQVSAGNISKANEMCSHIGKQQQ